MEDPRWLRLITIGLVLAALAVGYFLLSGRSSSNSSVIKEVSQSNQAVPGVTPSTTATFPTPTPTPASAYSRIASRTQSNQIAQTLPKTGFPAALVVVFAISGIISGWGLRKFPN